MQFYNQQIKPTKQKLDPLQNIRLTDKLNIKYSEAKQFVNIMSRKTI